MTYFFDPFGEMVVWTAVVDDCLTFVNSWRVRSQSLGSDGLVRGQRLGMSGLTLHA